MNSVLSNDNNVIDSTCGDSMKAGESCQYSCGDDSTQPTMPTGLNQATETGQSRTLTCTPGGGTITATGYDAGNDAPAPACQDCTQNNTGINCATTACDLSSTGGLSNTGVRNVNCGSYLAADAQCEYECAADSEPTDTVPLENGNGRIVCATAGSTASITAGCQACTNQESGVNCVTPSCNLATYAYAQTVESHVDTDSSTCGNNDNYLKAGTDCVYSCGDGYMPNTLSSTNTARQVDCSANGLTTTSNSDTVTSSANQLTCVACGTGTAAAFTNYTGNNCQTPSCLVNSVLSNDNNVIDSTCGDSMKAGESCQYSCDDGFMPTGLNQATETGQSRTLTCASGGGTITATGYTAGNDEPACTACTGGRTGINCVNAGS